MNKVDVLLLVCGYVCYRSACCMSDRLGDLLVKEILRRVLSHFFSQYCITELVLFNQADLPHQILQVSIHLGVVHNVLLVDLASPLIMLLEHKLGQGFLESGMI